MSKRIAFFAHFDPDGIIDEYVVYYLKALVDQGIRSVLFATDCDLKSGEINRLPEQVEVVNSCRHGEYDFGSWKRCLEFCGKDQLAQYDELILCNDSCYGPIQPLSPVFEKMTQDSCDFWGITQVEYFGGYLPSYFLCFKKTILADPSFISFFENVGIFTDKTEFCKKYEVGLFRLLESKGYQSACYLNQYKHLCHSSSNALEPDVFESGMPFIRVMTVRKNPGGIIKLGQKLTSVCSRYPYPFELIHQHAERTAPGYRKYWSYLIGDSEKRFFGIIRIRTKPKPEVDRVRVKVWVLGLPIFYGTFPMRYEKL